MLEILEIFEVFLILALECLGVVLCAILAFIWMRRVAKVFGARIAVAWRSLAPLNRIVALCVLAAFTIYGGGKGELRIENGELKSENGELRTTPTLNFKLSTFNSQNRGAAAAPPSGTDYSVFSNICFTSIAATPTNVVLGIGWTALTNTAGLLDIYAQTNLKERLWRHLAEMDVDAADGEAMAEVPLEWLDNPLRAFFNLGDRLDTDGDGLPDAFERLAVGSSPGLADSDGDGVPDGQEYALGTNPGAADTDGDLLPDGEEVSLGTDPVSADSDGDWLEDYEEVGFVEFLEGEDFLWFDLTNAVDLVNGQTFEDGRSWTVPLDYELELHRTFYTNAVIGLNGIVHLLNPLGKTSAAKVDCNHEGGLRDRAWSDRHATVALCNAHLRADAAWGSQILCGSAKTPGNEKFDIIEFRNVGLAGAEHTNQLVTCQFIMSWLDDAVLYASYLCASNAFRSADILCGVQMGEYQPQGRDRSRYCLECPGGIPGDRTTVKYTIGTGTDPLDPDTDRDGLGDSEESYGYETSPFQPDTDGDGMDDGWEVLYGFDPLTHNGNTARTDDDGDADPDGDGLTNGGECAYGTNPTPPHTDTDGDGVGDGAEVLQGTDPADGSDGGSVTNVIRVQFEFGDYSTSKSEKYRLLVRPVSGSGAIPKTHSFLNQRYNGTDTYVIPLKPGWKYEVTLRHASTDPNYDGHPNPDYDYRLLMTPQETPTRVILDDPDSIFGTNKENHAATFTTSPKVAHVYVLNPTVDISKSTLNGWDEMDEGEVVLSDEDMKIRIKVEPNVPSLAAMRDALGDNYTIYTDTKPEGAAVAFATTDQFVQNDNSSEVRITKTRDQLKSLGLLPTNEEDGVDEKASNDIGENDPARPSNLTDSIAFWAIVAESRHAATHSGNMDYPPPSSRASKVFFKSAGVEYVRVEYGGANSHSRQFTDQADFFYVSGHGNHRMATIHCTTNESVSASEIGHHWRNDLDCVVFAGCSVLDISDFVAQRLSSGQRDKWEKAGGPCSPGMQWRGLGPKYFLGYGWFAPLDTQGGNIIAASFVAGINAGKNPVEAWRIANNRSAGRNACAIDVSSVPAKFWYWKRNGWGGYTWECKTEGVDW